ncbi:hypothetical protein D5047_22970 [Verminephrobacter eiseniae]|nr:hypothetical protein [Verminephrobacter eiseniae]
MSSNKCFATWLLHFDAKAVAAFRKMLRGSFNPKAFDVDEAKERLAEYVETSMPKSQPVV